MTLSQHARAYASARHEAVCHRYGNHPYAYHLQMVADTALLFLDGYPPAAREVILAACWCHDLIEDARETYNDVKAQTGETVAEIVFALTNEKGRTRAERANDRYYAGIRATPHAVFVKLCDRIANVRASREAGSRLFDVYRAEYPEFRAKLHEPGKLEALWAELEGQLEWGGHPLALPE
jgi:(p)ppGpp synthase/HD superfamily hydrolase